MQCEAEERVENSVKMQPMKCAKNFIFAEICIRRGVASCSQWFQNKKAYYLPLGKVCDHYERIFAWV